MQIGFIRVLMGRSYSSVVRFGSVWFNFIVIATIKFKMIEICPLFFHFDGLIFLLGKFFFHVINSFAEDKSD